MLRIVSSALRGTARAASFPVRSTRSVVPSIFIRPDVPAAGYATQPRSLLSSALKIHNNDTCSRYNTLFSQPATRTILSPEARVSEVPVRTLTKFSIKKGKRKSVKAVLRRFYRLDWGMWIRTKAGRKKRLWTKRLSRKRRLRHHVMTTATQSRLLDTMVTKFWRRPKYYVDDPYNPYHKRENFFLTRKNPQPV